MGATDTRSKNKKGKKRASRPVKPQARPSGSKFNIIARLIAWYTLYTVLFRCPPTPDADSPTICHTSHTISTSLRPHLEPYYNAYVAPYVEQYSPQVKHANEVYIVPAYNSVSSSFEKYAAPHVSRSQEYLGKEYARAIRPRVNIVLEKGNTYYKQYLDPHVKTLCAYYTTVQPHIEKAKESVTEVYADIFLPVYEKVLPYAIKVYEQAKYVVVVFVAPVVKGGSEKAIGYGREVWREVVKPQVGRIGERLGNGNNVPVSSSAFASLSSTGSAKATAEAESLSSIAFFASAKAKQSASSEAAAEATGESIAVPKDDPKKLTPEEVRATIEADLDSWTEKFKAATEKTISDLNAQIDDISLGAEEEKAPHVQDEIANLESLVEKEFNSLKNTVIKITTSLSKESTQKDKEAAQESLFTATRNSGTKIRDRAQQIRVESQTFLAKFYDDIAAAADSHLDVLDSVLDIGMQELGMKWAWIDGVTYKDWKRYHALKKESEGTRREVIKSAETNKSLFKFSKWAEKEWEGFATDIAKDAAEELKRLKRVGKRKIELVDTSEDFSDSILPIAVEKMGQKVLEAVTPEEESEGKNERFQEKAQAVLEDVKESVSEKVHGTEMGTAEKIATKVSEVLVGTDQPAAESVVSVASESIESVTSVASEVINEAVSAVSEKIYPTEPNAAEKAATVLSDVVFGKEEPTPLASSASSILDEATEKAEKIYKSTIKPRVPGGVEAGFVAEAREIIYEQDPYENTIPQKVQNAADAANEKLADASRAVSEAIAGASKTKSPGEKIASIASEKYEAAISAASAVLFGTPQPKGESMVSIATDKYSAAIAAASAIIYGTPTPIADQYVSQAQSVYERATEVAGDQYRAAKRRIATMVHAEDKPAKESLASLAEEKYSSALKAADKTYSGLLAAASGARESYDVALSKAKESYQAAIDAASIKIHGTPQPAGESLVSVAQEKYAAAMSEAEKSYVSVYSVVSIRILGTPTPAIESLTSAISQKASIAASIASDTLYGTSQAFTDSMSSAAAAAEERYQAIKDLFSELLTDKEPPFTESIMSRFSSLISETQHLPTILNHATNAYDSATSIVGETYDSATNIIASAIMTPPPALEEIISAANNQVQAAISAAREQLYGATQGKVESVSSVIGEAYESAQSKLSEAVYGRQTGAFESAQLRMNEAVESAKSEISKAVWGETTTPGVVGSAIGESYEQAQSKLSKALYGNQQSIVESAQARLLDAVESAKEQLSKVVYGTQAAGYAEKATQAAQAAFEAGEKATEKVKSAYTAVRDEL